MNKIVVIISLFCAITAQAMTVEQARELLGLSQEDAHDSKMIARAYNKKLVNPGDQSRSAIMQANQVLMEAFVESAPPLGSIKTTSPAFTLENSAAAASPSGTFYFFELRNRTRNTLNIQLIIDDGSNKNLFVFPKPFTAYPQRIQGHLHNWSNQGESAAEFTTYYQLDKRPISSFLPYRGERTIPVLRIGIDAASRKALAGKRLVIRMFDEQRTDLARYYISLDGTKTTYVSWEGGELRPQQGRNGLTISGLPLSHNALQKDLVREKP